LRAAYEIVQGLASCCSSIDDRRMGTAQAMRLYSLIIRVRMYQPAVRSMLWFTIGALSCPFGSLSCLTSLAQERIVASSLRVAARHPCCSPNGCASPFCVGCHSTIESYCQLYAAECAIAALYFSTGGAGSISSTIGCWRRADSCLTLM